jgi:hypothetical protein
MEHMIPEKEFEARHKRKVLGFVGLILALACWLIGAVVFMLSDRSGPYLLAFAALCAAGSIVQHLIYKAAVSPGQSR